MTDADTQGRWGGGAPMLSGTQLAHVGFMTKLPWYLRTASTVHLLDRWRAHDVLRLIADHHMPSIGGDRRRSWPCSCANRTSTSSTSPR